MVYWLVDWRMIMQRIVTFLREAKAELLKVDWPNRTQVTHSTLIVVGVTLAVAAFLGTLDYGFNSLVRDLLARR